MEFPWGFGSGDDNSLRQLEAMIPYDPTICRQVVADSAEEFSEANKKEEKHILKDGSSMSSLSLSRSPTFPSLWGSISMWCSRYK